jgi:hypothetical protein
MFNLIRLFSYDRQRIIAGIKWVCHHALRHTWLKKWVCHDIRDIYGCCAHAKPADDLLDDIYEVASTAEIASDEVLIFLIKTLLNKIV